jgi:hypothetical protein
MIVSLKGIILTVIDVPYMAILELIRGAQYLIEVIWSSGEEM